MFALFLAPLAFCHGQAFTFRDVALMGNLQPRTTDTNQLRAYWSFDTVSVSGASVTDISGRGNTATLNGGATIVSGHLNEAVQLISASSSTVTAADSASLEITSSHVTVSLWVKFTSLPPAGAYPNLAGHLSDYVGYGIFFDGDANQIFGLFGDGGGWIDTPGYTPSTGTWYHVVALNDGSHARLFVNGSEIGAPGTSWAGNPADTGATSFIMGDHYAGGMPMDGYLDEVRVYARAITTDEITALAAE